MSEQSWEDLPQHVIKRQLRKVQPMRGFQNRYRSCQTDWNAFVMYQADNWDHFDLHPANYAQTPAKVLDSIAGGLIAAGMIDHDAMIVTHCTTDFDGLCEYIVRAFATGYPLAAGVKPEPFLEASLVVPLWIRGVPQLAGPSVSSRDDGTDSENARKGAARMSIDISGCVVCGCIRGLLRELGNPVL